MDLPRFLVYTIRSTGMIEEDGLLLDGRHGLKNEVWIKFLNGSETRGYLAREFSPEGEGIDVYRKGEDRAVAYLFSTICYIKLSGEPDAAPPAGEEGLFEDVRTATGEKFHLRLKKNNAFSQGVFAYPLEPTGGFNRFFFTCSGLRLQPTDRPLGEVMKQQGLIDGRDLDEALEVQRHLRKRRVGEIIAQQTEVTQEEVEGVVAQASKNGQRTPQARIGDILIEAGLVTRRQVEEAIAQQDAGKRRRVGTILVEKGLISEDQLLTALARKFGLRVIDLSGINIKPEVVRLLSRDLIERMQVLPVEATESRLVVATSTPTDPTISENLRFATNRRIELVVASAGQIAEYISSLFTESEDSVEELIQDLDEFDIEVVEEQELEKVTESDSKVINVVNKILLDAHRRGVSDIHFEPEGGFLPLLVRYRKDGECFTVHKIAAQYKAAMISRIKIISKLDIAERRRPQSGKIQLKHGRERIEFRVEITPTIGGQEDAVLRVLSSTRIFPLDKLGFSPKNLTRFKALVKKPYGIILCVGPTGSGKTTSLHSAIAEINTGNRKIWTAEDPVEITQRGLRQVQVNAKIGFTFEEALRSFLRADPDVIMIGEMRDPVTAKAAIGASLTGHLVFSTLHTNNAPETIVRLIEMGEDPINFADAMLGIMAQRLVRRLCEACKEPYHPAREEYDELVQSYGAEAFAAGGLPGYSPDLTLMKAVGCPECEGLGFSGRIAIQELLVNTPDIRRAIKERVGIDALTGVACDQGMVTLRQDGIEKVFLGITDFNQVNQVCV